MALGEMAGVGPLARARQVLQESPEPGWAAIEGSVVAAVRAVPRGGWPLTVVDPDPGRAAGTIVVTDRAMKSYVAYVLGDDPDYAVSAIDVQADGMTVVAVRVELTGRYGVDLNVTAERARQLCSRAIADVTGGAADVPIEVAVTDVHR